MVSAKSKLKNALYAIDEAKKSLKRTQQIVPNDQNIRSALRELDNAEHDIERAVREID